MPAPSVAAGARHGHRGRCHRRASKRGRGASSTEAATAAIPFIAAASEKICAHSPASPHIIRAVGRLGTEAPRGRPPRSQARPDLQPRHFGLGHLRRCRAIAHSLVDANSSLSVLILSGLADHRQLRFPLPRRFCADSRCNQAAQRRIRLAQPAHRHRGDAGDALLDHPPHRRYFRSRHLDRRQGAAWACAARCARRSICCASAERR